jgi:hypothetical protein
MNRPSSDAPVSALGDLPFALIRVLDDQGNAIGPWNPVLDPALLRRAQLTMMLTRAYDDRMYRAQRQGKTSFYMTCTGEEAIAVGQAFGLDAVSADDLQAVGATLRRLERFWVRAADLMERPPRIAVSSPPAQPLFA